MKNAIVLTANSLKQANHYQHELELRQTLGIIPPDTLLLSVPDPSSKRVGSGGATLNALVAVVEHLSAREGYSTANPEVIHNTRVFILHSGGDSRRMPFASLFGKCFQAFPVENKFGQPLTAFDLLADMLMEMAKDAPAGVFVASSDVLLNLTLDQFSWPDDGVTGLAIPAPVEMGTNHGVFGMGSGNKVEAFFQKASVEHLRKNNAVTSDDEVYIDSGVIFFSQPATDFLLNQCVIPPLDACTYLGVDNGAPPMRFELYSDILLALAGNQTKERYLSDQSLENTDPRLTAIRELLWEKFRPFPFYANIDPGGEFVHIGTNLEYLSFCRKQVNKNPPQAKDFSIHHDRDDRLEISSICEPTGEAQPNTLIEFSHLTGAWSVGEGSIVSNVRSIHSLQIPDGVVLQEVSLPDKQGQVLTLCGIEDNPKKTIEENANFCNRAMTAFLDALNIEADDLWPGMEKEDHCLWHAKLFCPAKDDHELHSTLDILLNPKEKHPFREKWLASKRFSFQDIILQADLKAESKHRHDLFHRIAHKHVLFVIQSDAQVSLLPLFQRLARENHTQLFNWLDEALVETDRTRLARGLSAQADALAAFSQNKGGLRSGPARNPNWQKAFQSLTEGHAKEALKQMAALRDEWFTKPDFLVRAARHYEGAVQHLIHQSVNTASETITPVNKTPPNEVSVSCGARIDIAGGWTDTPPITYENGGRVINIAVCLNGKQPIEARVRRLDEPRIIIHSSHGDVVLTELEHLANYAQPLAPGALPKAILLQCGVLNLQSQNSLKKQLEELGGGFEIGLRSDLPTGSGLGGSSILSAALVKALRTVMGQEIDNDSLIHAVLKVEQMMSTGGGWQDQAGVILPAIKEITAEDSLPLEVNCQPLDCSDQTLSDLEDHLLLLYTGRTRLARNLLQDVIRRWYARTPAIFDTMNGLLDNASRMATALKEGDLDAVGDELDVYWQLKKQVATGMEPNSVRVLIEELSPFIRGASLTGAGGGGFLLALAKDKDAAAQAKAHLAKRFPHSEIAFYDVKIDRQGMQTSHEG